MANLVTYVKQAWQDAKTAITAARLNHMEDGINDCATQINKLGDSVSRIRFENVNYVKTGTNSLENPFIDFFNGDDQTTFVIFADTGKLLIKHNGEEIRTV